MPGRLSGPPRPALKGTHPLAIYHRAEDGFLQTLAVKSLLTNSGETGHRGPRDRIPFEVFGPIQPLHRRQPRPRGMLLITRDMPRCARAPGPSRLWKDLCIDLFQ